MGKKPFASKANATKYNLIFKSSEDASSTPQREWIEADRKVGIGKPDLERWIEERREQRIAQQYPEGHPLAWLQAERDQPPLSEARRKEIVNLGFPDDGYDYLQHVRQGHQQTTEASDAGNPPNAQNSERSQQAENGGPYVFIPAPEFEAPPEDYKAIDACRLTVHQNAEGDDDAAVLGLGARAFARELYTVRRRFQEEIDEMDELVRQLDGRQDGEGDLLEDFVLTATEGEVAGQDDLADSEFLQNGEDSDIETGSDVSSSEGYHPGPAHSESKSFASTYWRPERTDRNTNLSVIDERFEQLAMEYDSDDIGELDQLAGDPSTRGMASTDQFGKVFDQFLEEHATRDHEFEGGQKYTVNEVQQYSVSDEAVKERALAEKSIAMAKEHVRRLEQQEAEPQDPVEQNAYSSDDDRRENWDCESVLTTRSTLYNHPQRLDALPPRRPSSQIKLSHKTGLPTLRQNASASHQSDPPHPERLAKAPARKHDESVEDKRSRKLAVKEAKRDARQRKKEVKTMFKEEAQIQKRQNLAPAISVATLS